MNLRGPDFQNSQILIVKKYLNKFKCRDVVIIRTRETLNNITTIYYLFIYFN